MGQLVIKTAMCVVLGFALAAPAAQAIVLQPIKAGFEGSNNSQVGDYIQRPSSGPPNAAPETTVVHSGARAMRMRGDSRAITTNPVYIPAEATEAVFEYFITYDLSHDNVSVGLGYATSAVGPFTFFAASDFLEGEPLAFPNSRPSFVRHRVNLLRFKGQTIFLRFQVGGGFSSGNFLVIDDASVTITVPGPIATVTQSIASNAIGNFQQSRQAHSDATSVCGVQKTSATVNTTDAGFGYAAPGVLNRAS